MSNLKYHAKDQNITPRNYIPGSYGFHELLHTVYVQQSVWDEHILEHPSTSVDPVVLEKVKHISNLIGTLYQYLGNKHL